MSPAQRFLRRRRRIRVLWVIAVVAVAAFRLADWHFGRDVDDWQTFDHRPFFFAAALPDSSILIRSADGSTQQIVRLLGIEKTNASDYLQSHLAGKTVSLLLDSPQTRDSQRRLLAYVFTSDVENLNVEIVRDGFAYVDRQQPCLLEPEIRAAQAEAKKKKRGLWGDWQRVG